LEEWLRGRVDSSASTGLLIDAQQFTWR
jgi:hypothetical protein